MSRITDLYQFEVAKDNINLIDFLKYLSNDSSFVESIASTGIEVKFGNDIDEELLNYCFRDIASIHNLIESFTERISFLPLRIIVDPNYNSQKVLFKQSTRQILGIPAGVFFYDREELPFTFKYREEILTTADKLVVYNTKTQEYFKTAYPIIIQNLSLKHVDNISIYNKLIDIFTQAHVDTLIFIEKLFNDWNIYASELAKKEKENLEGKMDDY